MINILSRRRATENLDYSLYENQYLTTKALESGTITFTMPTAVTTSKVTNVSYRKNKGAWVKTNNSSSEVVITMNVVADDVIEWKGNATCYGGGGVFEDCSHWGGTASFNVYGNIMSMLYNDSFRGKTTYPSTTIRATQHMFAYSLVVDASNLILPATTCYGQAYMSLFDYCTSLIYPPAVLPAPVVKNAMYYNMFRGCTSMTTMPTILATSLDPAGTIHYQSMFSGCTALQYNTNQTIHIDTARYQCCQYMFSGCSSMVNAPNVDCSDIASGANYAFSGMFKECTNLQTPPERFDVDTVELGIFNVLFENCTSLRYAPIVNIRNVGSNTYGAFTRMFTGCTSLTDASGINIYFPENYQWNGQLVFYCMFSSCTNLVHGPSLHINGTIITNANQTFNRTFHDCQKMANHDIELNYDIDSNATITTDSNNGNYYIFANCKAMSTSPRMIRPALRDYEFCRAFDGSTKIRDVYVKFNTDTAGNALYLWLTNVGTLSGTRTVHQAGTLSLPTNSASGVPSNWTLDTTDWTVQRHARMTMWVDDFPYGRDVTDRYYGYGKLIDELEVNIEKEGANRFDYFGDTITYEDQLFFVWEGQDTGISNVSNYKLLTTTDNFYELYHQSLEYWDEAYGHPFRETNITDMTTVINKPFSLLRRALVSDRPYNNSEINMQLWIESNRLVKIYRNQG